MKKVEGSMLVLGKAKVDERTILYKRSLSALNANKKLYWLPFGIDRL